MAKKVTSDQFVNHVRSLISSDRTHDLQYYNVTPCLDSMGTTHVSVLAEDGSAVSVTSSINHMSVCHSHSQTELQDSLMTLVIHVLVFNHAPQTDLALKSSLRAPESSSTTSWPTSVQAPAVSLLVS